VKEPIVNNSGQKLQADSSARRNGESKYRKPVIDGLMKNIMSKALGASGLPPEIQQHYGSSAQEVISSLSDHALATFAVHVKGASFYESPEKLSEAVGRRAALPLGVNKMGGAWIGSTKNGHGSLHLSGAFESVYGGAKLLAAEVYAHEFSHAIDWDQKSGVRISSSPEWQKAWNEEIVGDKKAPAALSEYARTKPVEGWAEFGRLVHTKPDLAEKFPKCLAIWRERKYVRQT
jgi:hypothetical protein